MSSRWKFLAGPWQLILVVIFLDRLSGFAPGQSEATEIAKMKGWILSDVWKGSDGKVSGISIIGRGDDDIEKIDFSVFSRLKTLAIISAPMTDRSFAKLQMVPAGLRDLSFAGSKISEQQFINLIRKHKSLVSISLLAQPSITDRALAEVCELEGLFFLVLHGTKITDKGLPNLAKARRLKFLDLSRNDISDAGLQEIAKLERLDSLSLRGARITDKGLTNLKDLPLTSLDLSDNKVSDAGLKEIKHLKTLRYLSLDRTDISDTGIQQLRTLSELTTLSIRSTKVTEKGANRLKESSPDLEIKK